MRFRSGSLRCHALEGGLQRLDGGAMFGVVPKPLWSKRIAPDERNRIPLAMRCLLIEHSDGLVLVDTGLGNKENAKFHDIYGIENEGLEGATQLEDALATAGFVPADVRWVINTHLHFDHAGGNTTIVPPGRWSASSCGRPTPTRCFVVRRRARVRPPHQRAHPRQLSAAQLRAGCRREALAAAGGRRAKYCRGRVRLVPGHVPWQQAVLIRAGETAAFMADLIPTTAHLPLPWIMGYDLEPLRTLETKRAFLRDAVAGEWRLIFEHDASTVSGVPVVEEKEVVLRGVVEAPKGVAHAASPR